MKKLFILVDDDRDDVGLFAEALGENDPLLTGTYAEDAQQLFMYLEDQSNPRPDMIFLDLNLPDVSGWQCLARLKDDERYNSIPVVMYTTSNHLSDKKIASDMGADGFITKPTSYRAIVEILGRLATGEPSELSKILESINQSLPGK